MVSIFHFFDYQEYLKEYYEYRRGENSYFTYRYIGKRVEIDHAFIVKVFQGQKHISAKAIPRFSKLLNHSKKERDYFELLVLFSKSKSNSEIKHYFEKLMTYLEVSPLKIEGNKYEFYQKWFYTAVREVIGISGFAGDYKALAASLTPNITVPQAKKSVTLLKKLKLIEKNSDSVYQLTSRFISPGSKVKAVAIRAFQKETIALASEALENIPRDERDISTMTLSLSDDGVEKLKESLITFRKDIMRIADKDNDVTRAYQVNLQLFPLSGKLEGKK